MGHQRWVQRDWQAYPRAAAEGLAARAAKQVQRFLPNPNKSFPSPFSVFLVPPSPVAVFFFIFLFVVKRDLFGEIPKTPDHKTNNADLDEITPEKVSKSSANKIAVDEKKVTQKIIYIQKQTQNTMLQPRFMLFQISNFYFIDLLFL